MRCLSSLRIPLLLLAGCVISLTPIDSAFAKGDDSALRVEMREIAKKIRGFLKVMDQDSISIGQFTGPPQLAASAGPGIAKVLAEELKEVGIDVKRRAALGLEGKYRDVIDSKSKRLAAQITGRIVDRTGKELFQFSRGVFGEDTLASLFGATVELGPKGDDASRSKKLQESLDAPQVDIRDGKATADTDNKTPKKTRVSASSDSNFGIEICVKEGDKYVPRAAEEDEGLAFIKLNRDETYGIRLYNDAEHEVGVKLTIDGLSMFAFSDNKNYTRVIVPAKTSGLIKGWHKSNDESFEFTVTGIPEAAVTELGASTASVGTITATFVAAFPADAPPPDEPASRSGGDATGKGPLTESSFTEVQRTFGVTRSTVSVRYTK